MPDGDETTKANNRGQDDRFRCQAALLDDPTGLETAFRQAITDDFYYPPDDPDLREAYEAGFHNR